LLHFRNVASFHQNAARLAAADHPSGQPQASGLVAAELGVQNERGPPGHTLHIHDVKQRTRLR